MLDSTHSTYALYRVLGKPASEIHDGAYKRLRWTCGCVARGFTGPEMHLTKCLLHRSPVIAERLARAR